MDPESPAFDTSEGDWLGYRGLIDSELSPLLDRHKFGRYLEDPDLPGQASQAHWRDHVRGYWAGTDAHDIEVRSGDGRLDGVLLFKLSRWDTDHFGYPVVIVDSIILRENGYASRLKTAGELLDKLGRRLRSQKIRFASIRIPALDLASVHALEKRGFEYIESWIYNKFDLRKLEKPARPARPLRLATPADEAAMIAYSQGAFDTQRFHADGRIDRRKADSLYVKWIKTTFRDPLQKTLVMEVENKPAAFMTYYQNDLRGRFGLRFVLWKMALLDPALRGKGLGAVFFDSLLRRHREEGFDIVDSGLSMRNIASLNLHNKCGFKTISTVLTFHKWLG